MSVTLSLSWHIHTNLRSIRSLCLRIARPQWSDLSWLAFFMWMQTCLPSLNSDVVQRCVCVCVFVRMCPDLICCYLHTHHPPLLHAFWPSDLAASQVSQTRLTNESTRLWVNECGATLPHHHPAITRSTNYTANSGFCSGLQTCHCCYLQGVELFSPRPTNLRKCKLQKLCSAWGRLVLTVWFAALWLFFKLALNSLPGSV